jgi:arylsulfatase A-like enzyme
MKHTIALLTALVLAPLATLNAADSPKPNILFILADDLGWTDGGCFGSKFYETPNIDRLAARGMRFTQAYAANPLCSPTRASILTGQSPARIGITYPDCHEPVAQLEKKLAVSTPRTRVLNADSLNRLKPEYFTLAEAFQAAGFATAHFGKWHLGHQGPYEPKDHGFQVEFPHAPAVPGPAGGYFHPWKFIPLPGIIGKPGEHIEERMAKEAAEYIHAHRGEPFFLNYWAYSVHAPFNARRDYIDHFKAKLDAGNPQHNPLYAAMVKSLDDGVGRILKAVDEAGIADRTIIVFSSDNGGYVNMPKTTDPEGHEHAEVTSNAPLRGGKGSLYEGGTRVPCVIVWPGKTKAGATSDALFQSTDFYPTLLAMCGLKPQKGLLFDGMNQSAALLGQAGPRDRVFSHAPHGVATGVRDGRRIGFQPGTYVRRGDWKLIRFYADNDDGSDSLELYHLKADPGETKNLAAAQPELTQELNALVSGFLKETEAVVPKRNPDFKGPAVSRSNNEPKARSLGPLQGWVPRDCKAVVKNGRLVITEQKDTSFLGFPVGKLEQSGNLRFRVRGIAGSGRLDWMPNPSAGQAETKSTPFVLTSGEWQEVSAALPAPLGKTGLMRLYLPAQQSGIEVEWVELISGDTVRRWDFSQKAGDDKATPSKKKQNPPASPAKADEASAWQREATPLLSGFVNMYNPCVVETGGEWRYRMWFFGWSAKPANRGMGWGCDAIFHARSHDMKTWEVWSGDDQWDATMNPERWRPVLHASERWYDNWHNGDPSVVFENGRFHMAYSATSKTIPQTPGYPSNMVLCIMGATSGDGIHWEKTNQPLLIRQEDIASPRPEPDRIGDFHRPCLRREAGVWKLWFDYWVPGKGACLGLAENTGDFSLTNGFMLKHDPAKPLLENWPNPEVVRIGHRWHSFADPAGYPIPVDTKPDAAPWIGRQLREAVSDDGLHWQRLEFIPPDADAVACHVPQALVTRQDGRDWLYLLYATEVGYTPNDKRFHYEYDRIRAMRREIQPYKK